MASEQSIHECVWAVFSAYGAPGAVLFHIPNEGIRGPRERAKFKRMGGVAGVPDFMCMANGKVSFLELKRAKGRVSPAQTQFISAAYAHGVATFVARSASEAVELLQSIGVLRADVKFTVTCDPDGRGAQDGSEARVSDPSIRDTQETRSYAGIE